MARFPKPYADLVQRFRVASGFLLLAAFAWWSDPSMRSMAWGVPVSLLGLMLRVWAAGHLAKNERLSTGGPYAYVRNPLYAGTLVTAGGLVIASRSIGLAVLFGAVFLLVYLPVIEQEEQKLRKLFPEFQEYSRRVPLLLPSKSPLNSGQPFRSDLFRRNREYKALLGYLVALALLVWKAST